MMRRTHLTLLALAALGVPTTVNARATIVTQLDGSGFSDPTPVAAVGGNTGTTLGEQRRVALKYALSRWEARLDSAVPIVLHMTFEDMGCMGSAAVLGATGATNAFGDLNMVGAMKANPKLVYVSALADSLAGYDMQPGEPDIDMHFNSAVDGTCRDELGGFYYGLDGKSGDDGDDFVQVILHEFAHGIGITSLWDPDNGQWAADSTPDSYSAHVRDLDLGKSWIDLTAAERISSSTNVRRVVWDGAEATRLVPALFAPGEPTLRTTPVLTNFTGFVADTDFAKMMPVSAQVVVQSDCSAMQAVSGSIVMLAPRSPCSLKQALQAVSGAGAVGLLLPSPQPFDAPALPIDEAGAVPVLPFPVLTLPTPDARSVVTATQSAPLQATLEMNANRRSGADDDQHALLFISRPYSSGSSIAHLEALVRPNQLMEPYASTVTHDLEFTVAMLKDTGWSARCGDGSKDPGEECDDGAKNDDRAADACRSDCTLPRCGDAVKDTGEGCDTGVERDDARADACRTNCEPAQCGDGVIDRGEQCDQGAHNSDREAGACRTNCHSARCGDGVVDGHEECDDGAKNSDDRADACRSDCRAPRCGDGVRDGDEGCDHGSANGNAPNACRSDCTAARCGDGIVDDGEACDGQANCTTECQLSAPPHDAHDGHDAHDAGLSPETEPARAMASQTQNQPVAMREHSSGCGCRMTRASGGTRSGLLAFSCLLLGLRRRARLRRRSQDA